MREIRDWGADFAAMFLPRTCEVCGCTLMHGEEDMCLNCRLALPRAELHLNEFSTIHQRLLGPAHIERGASWFHYYRGNPYTKLIHVAKYGGRPSVARRLARDFAYEITGSGFFDGIDRLVPVPLHSSKLHKRGFNQSERIAQGIADVTGIKIEELISCTHKHMTQTRLGAFSRWINAKNIYEAKPEAATFDGMHLLVIDDVLTTGATLKACCESLRKACPNARLSVLTLAITSLY